MGRAWGPSPERGVFRTEDGMTQALNKVRELRQRIHAGGERLGIAGDVAQQQVEGVAREHAASQLALVRTGLEHLDALNRFTTAGRAVARPMPRATKAAATRTLSAMGSRKRPIKGTARWLSISWVTFDPPLSGSIVSDWVPCIAPKFRNTARSPGT